MSNIPESIAHLGLGGATKSFVRKRLTTKSRKSRVLSKLRDKTNAARSDANKLSHDMHSRVRAGGSLDSPEHKSKMNKWRGKTNRIEQLKSRTKRTVKTTSIANTVKKTYRKAKKLMPAKSAVRSPDAYATA